MRQPQSTHSPGAFYELFPAEQARRLSKKIEFVYTPTHGLWLNMVEIELSYRIRLYTSEHERERKVGGVRVLPAGESLP